MAVKDKVQLHATIPRELRRRLRGALVWREESYKEWLCQRIEVYIAEVEKEQRRAALGVAHEQTT